MRVPRGNIQTYQRQVGLDVMPGARVEGPTNAAAYGANVGQAMAGMGDALAKAAAVQDKIQEDKIASDVVAAQTEYRKRLSDALYVGDNALLNRKGENADGIDKEYTDTERKIRQEVMGKLPRFELAHKAFMRTADQKSQSGLELVNCYRQQEVQRTFKTNLVNALTTNAEITARNYNNPVALQQGLATNDTYYKTYEARFGKAEAEALRREHDAILVNKALENAWGKDDYSAIKTLLNTYSNKLGADQASKWQHAITEKEKANERASLLSSLKNNPAFKDANGFFDVQKGMDYLRGMKKKVTVGGKVGPGFEGGFETFKASTVGIESDGDYDAQGPVMPDGDQALGKYQIMRSNWPKWTEEAGLGYDAPLTPANQDAVYKWKVKQYYDQFGGDWGKVAVAWQAGPTRAEWSDDRLATINDGNMTPVEYRQRVLSAMGGGQQTSEQPMFDEAELAQFEKQFQALHAEDIRKDNEQQHFALQNVQDWLAVNKDLPLDQKIAYVNASGLRPSQSDALTTGMIKEVKAEQKAQMEQTSKIASGALELLNARGALTTSSVEALAGQLTTDAFLHYLAKATTAQKTDSEKVNNAVDKDWHALIKNDPVFGNDDQQNALIGSIAEILNVEHTEGYDRRVKASKLIEEARDKGKREYIAGYSTRNNQAFIQMEELFPGSSTLVLKGDPNVDGYEWIEILKRMSAQTYEDPAAAKAWNKIFDNRLPLTENSFNELTEFYRQEGV